ncbi:hypothetical protein Nepgr_025255 [Nepenthes gracilis]|uniref:Uncharacterized protein n=1 Tax=Nepenthes gracilis TaxID=150966 RepID=A0AAD3XZC8_NEPGR|nr:hypothetical protein Nepgr_025255 [Nepenthes gracilis]
MREIAKQRAIQRQEEEEERTREQKAKARAKLEELDRRGSANQSKEGSIQNSENVASHGSGLHKQEEDEERPGLSFDAELSRAALTPSCNAERETGERSASKVLESAVTVLQQNQPLLTSQEGISTQHKKRMGYKQSVPFEKSPAEKSISATLGDSLSKEGSGTIVSACDSNLPVESLAISEPSVHHRRKNSRTVKNKHKLEESSSAVQLPSAKPQKESHLESTTENVIPDSSKLDPKSVQSLDDSKDAIPSSENPSSLPCENTHGRVTNSWKQHPRKNPRNAPVNRSSEILHGNNAVVWTPVRSLSKVEVIDDTNLKAAESAAAPAKGDHLVHNTSKSRRAEMERYVPKPVAKELAQQASAQQSSSPSVDQMTNVETKNTDSKPRGVTNASMNMQTSPELLQTPKANEELLAGQAPKPDEWDDGWNIFDENVTAPRVAYLGVKYQGFSGRGKQNSFRGNRGSGICHHTLDPKNSKDSQSLHVDTIQTERTASSKENRVVGHWQPKSQVYVNNDRDVDPPSKHKEDTSADITEPLPVQCASGKTDLYGRQNEGRRETQGDRKAAPLEGNDSRADRSSNVQDDKQQHYGNRDRRRQNPQYEYQHVRPYNTSKSSNSESQTDNLNMGGPRFRERRHSHSRGNGGSFYGRGKGEILK